MLLSVKKRQTYLKELGFYTGEVDGKVGPLTKKAYKDLQVKYFTKKTRPKDTNGIYGSDTDTLLRNVYKCKNLKHFKVTEFRCKCTKHCTGYPVVLDTNLLAYLDDLRSDYKKSINITSGMRCKTHNKNVGGSTTGRHTQGKAADIYMSGTSDTHKGRQKLVDYWIKNYENSRYAYCKGYGRTKSKISYPSSNTMGNATHLDVK